MNNDNFNHVKKENLFQPMSTNSETNFQSNNVKKENFFQPMSNNQIGSNNETNFQGNNVKKENFFQPMSNNQMNTNETNFQGNNAKNDNFFQPPMDNNTQTNLRGNNLKNENFFQPPINNNQMNTNTETNFQGNNVKNDNYFQPMHTQTENNFQGSGGGYNNNFTNNQTSPNNNNFQNNIPTNNINMNNNTNKNPNTFINYYPNSLNAPEMLLQFSKVEKPEEVSILETEDIQMSELYYENQIEQPLMKSYWCELNENTQSSPDFIQTTINCAPSSKDALTNFKLPFGVVVKPFFDNKNEKIPTVDFGESIVRCKFCKTYINPMFQFFNENRKFKCNVCYSINDTPQDYIPSSTRPEFQHGTIEFCAPKDYMNRTPQPSAYIFMIDVTNSNRKHNQLKVIADSILKNIKNLEKDERTLFGLITFDEQIHCYDLSPGLKRPHMHSLKPGDPTSVIPFYNNLLVNLQECKEQIVGLLEKLGNTIFPIKEKNSNDLKHSSCVGSCLNVAGKILGRIGGKLIVFANTIPSLGSHVLKNRESLYSSQIGLTKENRKKGSVQPNLLIPQIENYTKLAKMYKSDQISVDWIISSLDYSDITSIYPLVKLTGGRFKHYPYMNSIDYIQCLRKDIERIIKRKTVFEAVMRVRVGPGYEIDDIYGNCNTTPSQLIIVPVIDSDFSVACTFKMKDNEIIISNKTLSIQSAVLFTDDNGKRKIRVHNLTLPVMNRMSDLFNTFNNSAMSNVITRIISKSIIESGDINKRSLVKDYINQGVKSYAYNVKGIDFYNAEKIIVPKTVKIFSIEMYSFYKKLFVGRVDDLVHNITKVQNMSINETKFFLIPECYDVENFDKKSYDNLKCLTKKNLSSNGIYFVIKDEYILLFIGYSHYSLKAKKEEYDEMIEIIHYHNNSKKINKEEIKNKMAINLLNIMKIKKKQIKNKAIIEVFQKSKKPLIDDLNSTFIQDQCSRSGESYFNFIRGLLK